MFSSFVDVLCATQWLYPVKCNLFYSLFHNQGCYFKLYSSSEGSYGRGLPQRVQF